MALQIIASNTIGAGVQITLASGDDIIVMAGATLGSTDNNAVAGAGTGHRADIYGNVAADNIGIYLGDDPSLDSRQTVIIRASGLVHGDYAGVWLYGYDSILTNAGEIYGASYGVVLGGIHASEKTVVTNSGSIISDGYGIVRPSSATEKIVLTNSGLIEAVYAYDSNSSNAIDEITNSGRIIGVIKLALGADLYDGRSGRLTGSVEGGDGADRIFGGIDNDVFYGNADNDTLRGGAGNDTLDGGTGNDRMEGGAGNDSYGVDSASDIEVEGANQGIDTVVSSIDYTLANNFERLTLTGVTNINGTGNAVANIMIGGTGNNVLSGLGGNDNLTGLAGADTLTGGADADQFIYKAVGDSTVAAGGRDTITDFSHAQGDRIHLAAIDADNAVGGNQTFSFIGTDAFSATAGELRQFRSGANTVVQGDIDGNGSADFAIVLTGVLTLVAGDFVL